MNIFIHLLLFVIIVFIYLHIQEQFKTSEDLEVFEMDYTTNTHLQEVCDLKQPIIFEYKSINPDFFEDVIIEDDEGSQDVYVKDTREYLLEDDQYIDPLVLPYSSTKTLIKSDTGGYYFSEGNYDFVEEVGLRPEFESNDSFFKPTMNIIKKYDICFGSKNAYTPLRYHTHYREFYIVHQGKIRIKMTPFKSRKWLNSVKDYDNYEFRCSNNPWSDDTSDKIKYIEFDVNPGFAVYIPPYWWYSIRYVSEGDNLISGFTYCSLMNCISNISDYGRYYLQQHNTKKKIVRTLPDLDKESNEIKEAVEMLQST